MPTPPLRISLSDERKGRLREALQAFYMDEFDEDLSAFRADGLIDLFLSELGPAVYNQGVQDACAYLQEKLGDLEAEVYEPEPQGR